MGVDLVGVNLEGRYRNFHVGRHLIDTSMFAYCKQSESHLYTII